MRWLPGTRILTEAVGGGLVVRGATKVPRAYPPRNRGSQRLLRGSPETELFEPHTEVLEAAAHAGCEHPQVRTTDREHPTVEVLARELDRRREAGKHLGVRIVDLVQADQVDRETVRLVDRAGGAVDETDLAFELTRQELVGRHFIDLGQPEQAGHRDGPLAPLVRTEHRRLELEARPRLHVVKRQ